jgi:hypothetical protein
MDGPRWIRSRSCRAGPTSGTAASTVLVSVSPAGLGAGTYTGSVQITAAGESNSPVSVTATLTVAAGAASLAVAPQALTFNYTIGGAAPTAQTRQAKVLLSYELML